MKSKVKVIALAGILGVAVVGGTFAYFTQTDSATNKFHTGTYDTELVEEFKPKEGENWEPGVKVNKDVHVENTGSLPVVVRVKFRETWTRKAEVDPKQTVIYDLDTTQDVPWTMSLSFVGNTARNKFESVRQADPNDGRAGLQDDSVVIKELHIGKNAEEEQEDEGVWVYNSNDGWYYFTRVLAGKTEDGKQDKTTKILDSVTLAADVDMGDFVEKRWYSTQEEEPGADNTDAWIEFATSNDATRAGEYLTTREMSKKLEEEGAAPITYMKTETVLSDPNKAGYSDAEYTLTITAQTVQATDKAVAESWGIDLDHMKELGVNWDLKSEGETMSGDEPAETTAEESAAP